MNVVAKGPWPVLSKADALLMDVARRIQLTATKHQNAETNFKALCSYVDRAGSPLHGLVLECYPSGSFATGTAIASRVAKSQHDVDVVIELDVPADTDPESLLETLYEAINGDQDGRYHGKVELNSRCVTVSYEDGTTVDLMPVARLAREPERAGHLFHWNPEAAESYHKPVNPWGFASHFNRRVEFDPRFYDQFKGRRLLVEGDLLKAETQPMPEHAPLEEKSPRVVALQLLKRARDIAYRKADHKDMRKPPAVVLAAIALEAGPTKPSLVDEVISVAQTIRERLRSFDGPRGTVSVLNPSYKPDVFTDRWPEDRAAQILYDADLRRLIVELYRLRNEDLGIEEMTVLLRELFGESAASYAIESYLEGRRHEMESGNLRVGPTGRVLGSAVGSAPAVVPGRNAAARPATREGGGELSE